MPCPEAGDAFGVQRGGESVADRFERGVVPAGGDQRGDSRGAELIERRVGLAWEPAVVCAAHAGVYGTTVTPGPVALSDAVVIEQLGQT